jgi:hypothetical protein
MSKNAKIFLGVLTLLPVMSLFYYLWAFISLFSQINRFHNGGAPDANALSFDDGFFTMLIVLAISVIFSIGLLIYYIIHAVNNKKLSDNDRMMWIVLFIFIANIAFMIYFVLKIWQDKGTLSEPNTGYLDKEI